MYTTVAAMCSTATQTCMIGRLAQTVSALWARMPPNCVILLYDTFYVLCICVFTVIIIYIYI